MEASDVSPITMDSIDEAATQMLKDAFFRVTTVTHASMACSLARRMDPNYASPYSASVDDIRVDLMTTQHKTHLCIMMQQVVL